MAIRYTIGIEKIALSKRGFESLVQDSKKLISRISNAEGGMGNGWIEYFDSDSGEPSYYVACDKCGYEAETKQPTYEEAVDHWNRRASFDIHNADEGEKGLYSDPI